MTATARPRPRAVLLGVQLPDVGDEEFASSLDELGRLVRLRGAPLTQWYGEMSDSS
jgi:hypothetical protein